MAPDSTTVMPFSRTDCARLTIHAPHNPAEGVRVEPYKDGRWVVRRASLAGSTLPCDAGHAGGLAASCRGWVRTGSARQAGSRASPRGP